MQNNNEKRPGEINIELPDEVAEGEYSNLIVLAHSQTEFVLDFVRIVPNTPRAKVRSRILLHPQNAKRLLQILHENIRRYESQYGVIKESEPQNQPPFPPIGFHTGQA